MSSSNRVDVHCYACAKTCSVGFPEGVISHCPFCGSNMVATVTDYFPIQWSIPVELKEKKAQT